MAINVSDKFKICIDGVLPLLSAMCDKVGLKDRIDAQIESEQNNRIVSTGTAIKSLVMNIVAKRKALYKLNEFYELTDTQKLFNEGIRPCNLTDDVMARALDELYEIGPKKIMTETAMASINEFNIPVTGIHADTTSKSVYGAYEDSNKENESTITFVSRLPGNYKLEKELKAKAMENPENREPVGTFSNKVDAAEYKAQSFEDKLCGNKYRFIVCHSNQLEKRKEKTLNNKIDKEKESLLKAIDEFHKIDFYCVKDAIAALEKFEKDLDLKYHELVYMVKPLERKIKREKPGRPKKDEPVQFETVYKADIQLFKDDIRIKEYKDKESLFVLITNSMDKKQMNNKAIIKEYKEQSSVETTFRVLKDPYFIDELFVKTPQRLEALSYVILIALMILILSLPHQVLPWDL